MLCSAWWGRTRKSQELAHRKCDHIKKQDPVSTMQKTGMTNYSSLWYCLVWKRVSLMDLITMRQSTAIFLCIWPFWAWWHLNNWTNKQPSDPRAILLFTSDKAVCCNIHALIHWFFLHQAAWWDGIRGPGVPESSMTALPAWTRNWTTGGKIFFLNFWLLPGRLHRWPCPLKSLHCFQFILCHSRRWRSLGLNRLTFVYLALVITTSMVIFYLIFYFILSDIPA